MVRDHAGYGGTCQGWDQNSDRSLNPNLSRNLLIADRDFYDRRA